MAAARQLQVVGGAAPQGVAALLRAEQALGISQHHDAISGTAKQHVSFDYAKQLAVGQTDAEAVVAAALTVLLQPAPLAPVTWAFCRRLNETVCPATQRPGAEAAVVVYSQLGQARVELVLLPVAGPTVHVVDAATHQPVAVQTFAADETLSNYARRTGETPFVAAFQATVAAVGVSTYQLFVSASPGLPTTAVTQPAAGQDVVLENKYLSLVFAGTSGRLRAWTNKETGARIDVDQVFCYYRSSLGETGSAPRSGAYVFRPDENDPACHPILAADRVSLSVVTGPVVQEVRQVFADWVTQTVRLTADARHAEFEFTIGPIDIADPVKAEGWGREIVTKFVTSIASQGEWRTDSNGREMIRRRRNFRPQWNFSNTEAAAGNYAPVATAVHLADADHQLTVLVDSPVGAASLADGTLELMLHRRVLHDDHLGVDEALNETQFVSPYVACWDCGGKHTGPALVIRGRHWVTVEAPTRAASVWRPLQDRLYATPVLAFSTAAAAGFATPATSMLAAPLPPNVQLLTLHALNATTVLLRLAHAFAMGEDAALAQPVRVDLSTLFSESAGFKIVAAQEVSLTGNQPVAEVMRRRGRAMQWTRQNVDQIAQTHPWRTAALAAAWRYDVDPVITLGPMEIKTFDLTVVYL